MTEQTKPKTNGTKQLVYDPALGITVTRESDLANHQKSNEQKVGKPVAISGGWVFLT